MTQLSEKARALGEQPAYPGFSHTDGHGPARKNERSDEWENYVPGITIRQEFAKAAMQGLVSACDPLIAVDPNHIAALAITISSALLEALVSETK